MPYRVIDFQHALAALPVGPALFTHFQQALVPFGVGDISYTCLSPLESGTLPRAKNMIFTTYNASMLRQLGGIQGFADDLTRMRAQQGLDTMWSDDAAWHDASPNQIYRYHLASEAGVRIGYTHCLGKLGQTTATLGLRLDGLTASEFKKHWGHSAKIILQMSKIMHLHFMKSQIDQDFKLSAREKDVLSWLAMGMRPDEIADKLNIGYRSVDKYIVSAKEKMGANSRDHAVARALALGLLDI